MNEDRERLLKAIADLENKGNGINKKEYKELQQLKALRDSEKDIREIAIQSIRVEKYKEKLKEELREINAEVKKQKRIKDLKNEIKTFELELNTLRIQVATLTEEIEKSNIDDKDRQSKILQQEKLKSIIAQKGSLYMEKQQQILQMNFDVGKFSNKTENELNNMKVNICSKISKCNIVISNLEYGKDWNQINMSLDKYEGTFTLQENKANKSHKEIQLLPTETEEKRRKPILSKVANWFKKNFKQKHKRKNKRKKEKQEFEELSIEENNEEISGNTNKIKSQDVKFKNYIKYVAMKGYETADKEIARIKLEENKEEAKRREAKYGERYE